ncbi:MAG: hypothetical protein Q7J82_06635 [Coriobacteriia bacterium]|nr:hypothetical protein [Coriobacteriia bacterium]
MGLKTTKAAPTVTPSVTDWLPVEDIREDHVVLTDGTLTALLRVTPADLALLGESDRRRLITAYQEAYNGERGSFALVIMPRTVDLERYMMRLENRLSGEANPHKRLVLKAAMSEAARLVREGACVERQYYFVVIEPPNNDGHALDRLRERSAQLVGRLAAGGVEAQRCAYDEIHRALMLYAMPRQAAMLPAALELSLVPMLEEA